MCSDFFMCCCSCEVWKEGEEISTFVLVSERKRGGDWRRFRRPEAEGVVMLAYSGNHVSCFYGFMMNTENLCTTSFPLKLLCFFYLLALCFCMLKCCFWKRLYANEFDDWQLWDCLDFCLAYDEPLFWGIWLVIWILVTGIMQVLKMNKIWFVVQAGMRFISLFACLRFRLQACWLQFVSLKLGF